MHASCSTSSKDPSSMDSTSKKWFTTVEYTLDHALKAVGRNFFGILVMVTGLSRFLPCDGHISLSLYIQPFSPALPLQPFSPSLYISLNVNCPCPSFVLPPPCSSIFNKRLSLSLSLSLNLPPPQWHSTNGASE